MLHKQIIVGVLLAISLLTTPLSIAWAQGPSFDFTDTENQNQAFLQESGLGTTNISVIVSNVIKILLSFLGIIFVVLIIYAGFLWMTAAGDENKISKAKTLIAGAIIGLAIVLAAYAITYYVIDQVIEATKGGHGLD